MTKGELIKVLERVDDNAELFIVPDSTNLLLSSLGCIDVSSNGNRVYLYPQSLWSKRVERDG